MEGLAGGQSKSQKELSSGDMLTVTVYLRDAHCLGAYCLGASYLSRICQHGRSNTAGLLVGLTNHSPTPAHKPSR